MKKIKDNPINKDINSHQYLEHINRRAAGIDIGSKSHFVAVPEGCDEVSVREFKSFTSDLYALADWLKNCGVETVAMESTGVYWIPLYELLESQGFEVRLVDARHVKNVSGRKTDVLDCQWLQQLHTYGLLSAAFRPNEQICALRAYLRQRNMLIEQASTHILHMQKALNQMNLQLHSVITDITGTTGLQIIRAIISGERDPKVLAQYRDHRCKNTIEILEKSLIGHYREEHVFSLKQALELYDVYQNKITACDHEIENQLQQLETRKSVEEMIEPPSNKRKKNKYALTFDLRTHLIRTTGVDLTAIPGIEATIALKVISEIGLDLSRWKTKKQFAAWLGLCPGNRVSGGKQLSGKTKRTANRAASALRIAAFGLSRSNSALGAYLRRLKARLGAPKAITATAHKLAVIIYEMLKNGVEYIESGQEYYEQQYQERVIKNLSLRAKKMGYALIKTDVIPST